MYNLRDYQVDMSDAIMEAFEGRERAFIAQAATSAGKSLIIAEVAKRLGKPLLVLQPSREILLQNYDKMVSYGLSPSMYSASVGTKEIGEITLATIQSIYKKPEDFAHFEYAMFDECHNFSLKGQMYVDFFKATNIKRVCGVTATPFRLEQRWFGDAYTGVTKMLNRVAKDSFFKDIVYKVEMADLIAKGYITKPIYHTYDTDLNELVVNSTGRDYTSDSLEDWGARRMTKLLAISSQLDAKHQRVLVFCTTIKQAEKGVDKLVKRGISAAVLTAKTPKKLRTQMIEDFQAGKIKWMLNVATMTTGFDCPPLDCVVLLRPTFSVPLLIQMVGRVVRLDPARPDKEAHVYDFTGNIEKFGHVEDICLGKEGFKDTLESSTGRIDNIELWRFDKRTGHYKGSKPETPKPPATLEYLLSLR